MFARDLTCQNQSQPKRWKLDQGIQGIIEDIWIIFREERMDEATKLSYVEDFCFSAPGMKNIPNLTSIIQKATNIPLSTATQIDIVESQALMEDNAVLFPQGDGRMCEHRSVNITNFNPLAADDPEEFPHDNGDVFITVYRSNI